MVRSLVSWLFIVVFAVVFCGFIAGCEEEQAKEPATEIKVVEPVVETAEKVAKPIVETVEKVTKPIVETAGKVVETVVEVTENAAKAAASVVEKKPAMPRVTFVTSMGEIIIELNPQKAPITVKNFLRYVKEGFYEGVVFHRVIPGFMIQGGGFDVNMLEKETHATIKNESNNRLANLRGTIAMARQPQADSATSQFFINVNNNTSLNYGGPNGVGYAVFGKVVKGLDVVDAIVEVQTTTKRSNKAMMLPNNPVEPVVIKSAISD